jgi:hypothetical protein
MKERLLEEDALVGDFSRLTTKRRQWKSSTKMRATRHEEQRS